MYKGAEDIKNSGFNKISNISFNSNTQHLTQFNMLWNPRPIPVYVNNSFYLWKNLGITDNYGNFITPGIQYFICLL